MDIPEFYELAEELFSPEEAAVYMAIPRGFSPAETVAKNLGKNEEEVATLLESMADKGLCTAGRMGEKTFYGAPPLVPGIFEFQFMRGTSTERDRKLARLIHTYKSAVNKNRGPQKISFPPNRVITVDRVVKAENKVHTYDQVKSYIEKYDPLAVSTCFCRHEAKLIDEEDDCGKPNDVCMQFGMGAQFVIDRNMGRKIDKDEAMAILIKSEEAGPGPCCHEQAGDRVPLQLLLLSLYDTADGSGPAQTWNCAQFGFYAYMGRRFMYRLRYLH